MGSQNNQIWMYIIYYYIYLVNGNVTTRSVTAVKAKLIIKILVVFYLHLSL